MNRVGAISTSNRYDISEITDKLESFNKITLICPSAQHENIFSYFGK